MVVRKQFNLCFLGEMRQINEFRWSKKGKSRQSQRFFDFSLTLFSWAEGALSKHNVDCSCASQEMPQLQITDQAKHVWRWALRGINSPPFPPSALTPATTFITARENIVSCPLTNTCQFQEKELLFFSCRKKRMCLLDP